MFETKVSATMISMWSRMAEMIAIEDDELSSMGKELVKRKENLDALKTSLAEQMFENDATNGHKFDNGLFPKPKIQHKIFKAAGVDDDTLFDWLRSNELGDIIKETVHYMTMQSALGDYVDQGNELPVIFNKSDVPTITMYGKSKFIEERKAE